MQFHKSNIIQKILENYSRCKPETLKDFADSFSYKFFNIEDIKNINLYLRKKVHFIKKEKSINKEYIEPLTLWMYKTESEDLFDKNSWAFIEVYDCPFVDGCENLDIMDFKKEEEISKITRIKIFKKLKDEYKDNIYDKLVSTMNNTVYWGEFLSEVCNDNEIQIISDACLQYSKYTILGGFLNAIDNKIVIVEI